jgi:YHS domain-containing protein
VIPSEGGVDALLPVLVRSRPRGAEVAVDPERSAGRLTYEDTAYFFCSLACAAEFARQPERFARKQS